MTKQEHSQTTVASPLPFRTGFSVFLAGAVVLFVEISGAKLLAPIFGSGLYVWSALITVTLLSIAAGAWAGGRWADHWPNERALSLLWIGGALTLGLAVPLRQLILPLADKMDLRMGAFFCSLFLFFPPLAFLSAIPPVSVKLAEPIREKLGRTVGWISSLGTAGSCFGALATGYFLVPSFPLTKLFLSLSLIVLLFGVFLWKGGKKISTGLFILAWGGCLYLFSGERMMSAMGNREDVTPLETRQNLYAQTQILQISSAKLLFLDGILQGGTYDPRKLSISEYTAGMEILGKSAVPNVKDVLVIGLGAGVLPARFQEQKLQVDVVDINPQVVGLCRKWFNFSLPEGKVHLEDGRRFLRKSADRYDLIFIDAFSGEELPSHLLTEEAFQDVHKHLNAKGALVLNYVGLVQGTSWRVLGTIVSTLKTTFSSVELFSIPSGDFANYILVARTEPGQWNPSADIPWGEGKTTTLAETLAKRFQPGEAYPFLLTDNYCPLDWLDRESRFAWRKLAVTSKGSSSGT